MKTAATTEIPPSGAPARGVSGVDQYTGLISGKRVLVVLFSHFPGDARPRRAAEALARHGMKVELICLKENPGDPVRAVVDGIQIRRVPIRRNRGGRLGYLWQYGSFLTIAFLLVTVRALRRRYDVIHVHNMPDILVFCALTPKLFGARVILDLHDPMPELMTSIFDLASESLTVRMLKRLEKWSIWFSDGVLTVNLACKKIFASRSCPLEKIHVVMNSPDEGIFQFLRPEVATPHRTSQRFVVMYHGSIVERHGLDLAVEALRKLIPTIPGAELRIYGGRTPFLDKVLASIKGTSIAVAVRHFGPKSHEEIAAAIDQCDLGIIPNRRSIFTEINTPTRIFEYLSRGKPVVAPAAPGIQDYFADDQLFFFRLGDADDLARQIKRVFDHPAEASRTVHLGQQVYLSHLWSRECSGLLDLVCNQLRRSTAPTAAPDCTNA